jgi:KaiC/GvpD/RAD55 family RecA-like ATPase
MDSERALLSSAISSGQIANLLSRGIESRHFSQTQSGQECSEIFDWVSKHTRKYSIAPSISLVRNNFPSWRGEVTEDPLEALIDEFLAETKRRKFESKVLELAEYAREFKSGKRDLRNHVDELMLDAARDLAATVPSGQVSRFRAEMAERIDQYEVDKAEGISTGIKMGIPLFDDLTEGFQPGDVVTIAGFSGRGKSLSSQLFLANALNQGYSGLLLSLEMSRRQIMDRFDTMVTNFSHRMLRKRELSDDAIQKWRLVANSYKDSDNDLIIADKLGACTIDRVYAEINRYKPAITCVDYVQLMKAHRASMAKWESLVEITNELKSIALSTESVIIMVSQDTRGSADDGSTESNVGGSISVLQASDVYIGMKQNEELKLENKMIMRLVKSRSSSIAESAMLWEPERMYFRPWDGVEDVSHNFDKGYA